MPTLRCAKRTLLRQGLYFRAAWTPLPMLLVLGPAARAGEAPAQPRHAPGAPAVGTATMLPDGTILLRLRAEGPGGMLGDAQLRYLSGDPHDRAVRYHLSSLRPGHTVPVPPIP